MTTAYDDFMNTINGNWYQWKHNSSCIPFQIVGNTGFPNYQITTREYNSSDVENSGMTHITTLQDLVKVSPEEAERIFKSSQSSPKETEQYATPTQAVKALRREMGEEPGLDFVDSLTSEDAITALINHTFG